MILGIYGASGLGTEFYETAKLINELENKWEQIIFVDNTPEKIGTSLSGIEIMDFEPAIECFGKENMEFIIAIGEPSGKEKVYRILKENECKLTRLINPAVKPGEGAVLGEGVVVQSNSSIPPYSKFGNNVLIQGSAIMGHDIELGDNVVISSLDFIGGLTKIGKNSYIAPHVCIRDRITIGENVVIGMGSVVTKDIPDNVVAFGNPCIVRRVNDTGKIFK